MAQANADIARMVPIWLNSWPMARVDQPADLSKSARIAPSAAVR